MSPIHFTNRYCLTGLAVALIAAAAVCATPVWAADCCSAHKDGAGHEHADHQHGQTRAMSIVSQPPHGGQVYATDFQYFEVVYRPQETRVYMYGHDQRPISPRGIQGQVAMQVRGHEKLFRYPLKYFTVAGGSVEQEYLAAAVDVSRVRDGDMRVTFQLANLPYRQQPQISFTQTFALTRERPAVTVVALAESDKAAIARQRVCPVSGGPLGSMGTPVKLLVGDQAVYLCCRGCIDKVRQDPERFAPKAAGAGQHPAHTANGSQLTVAKAEASDQTAIQAQGVCPVMNTRLGAHGTPVKVTRGDQSLFLCCQGCLSKVEKNPDYYFAQATRLRAGG